jgi:exosortase
MATGIETKVSRNTLWVAAAWFGALVVACYAPIMYSIFRNWRDPEMSHGYFVPLVAGFVVWQRKDELLAMKLRPAWWGLLVVLMGGCQVIVATLGVELFTARTALLVTMVGIVWTMAGTAFLRKLAFPLLLLLFMIPIPTIAYNAITFRLQILASKLADEALTLLNVPVLREGNILELPNQRLSVVEACSGIRSLLSLGFLALVYGYFFEKKRWIRITLFVATVPIAVIANGARVTATGVISQIKPELAEGFFHESTGWVIFMVALGILVLFHGLLRRVDVYMEKRAAKQGATAS